MLGLVVVNIRRSLMSVVLLNITAVHPILITSRIITITRQWRVQRPGDKANGVCPQCCFRLSVVKEKTNEMKGRYLMEPIRVKMNCSSEAHENANDQVMIGFSFASDWLRKQSTFSGPITKGRRANLAVPDYLRHSIDLPKRLAEIVNS